MNDPIVDAVCAKLQSRSAVGIGKYGVTLADSPEDTRAFLVHLQNELMDGANYVEKLLQPPPTDAERQAALDAMQSALDEFNGCGINPSNYKSDDVFNLNNGYEGLFGALEQAIKDIASLQSPRVPVIEILETVLEQAEDDGLWFNAKYASEAYLQQELRRLHTVIERAYAELQKGV